MICSVFMSMCKLANNALFCRSNNNLKVMNKTIKCFDAHSQIMVLYGCTIAAIFVLREILCQIVAT